MDVKLDSYQKYEILMNWVCNQNCIFCSTGKMFSRKEKIKSWEKIEEEIKTAKKIGVKNLSFSGGEPTIRKDLVKAIKLAKKIGFETIEIQSNGRMFKYDSYVEKLINAGANRFLISIHGAKPETHDFLTRVKGSFDECVQGIKNLSKRGMPTRFSVVINKFNYKEIPDIAKFLIPFKGFSYHLNYVTPVGYASVNYKNIAPKISEVVPYIKKAAEDILKSSLGPWIHNIYPCNMPGFEGMMSELMKKSTILSGPGFAVSIDESKMSGRKKPKQCRYCKWDPICAGPYREYLKVFGDSEFKYIKGEKVKPGEVKFQEYGFKEEK